MAHNRVCSRPLSEVIHGMSDTSLALCLRMTKNPIAHHLMSIEINKRHIERLLEIDTKTLLELTKLIEV